MNRYYLYHHGILGQKWGVRRYQNKDGSLTSAGKKRYLNNDGTLNAVGRKAYYKTEQNRYRNKYNRYTDEYDSTPDGAKKLKLYKKEIDNMFNDEKWDQNKEAQNRFYKAEEDYLRSAARYAANKLLVEYGDDKLDALASRGAISDGKKAVQKIEDEWWSHAV